MELDSGELEREVPLSLTWAVDDAGNIRHKTIELTITEDSGITYKGEQYVLGAEDVELDSERRLGSGFGGVVVLGTIKKTGTKVAVKTMKVDDTEKRKKLLNEIRGLVSAQDCPHLIQWYAGYLCSDSQTVRVALEYMDLGSLRDLQKRTLLGQIPAQILAGIFAQVMLGLHYLHGKRVIHRDIKPENILHNTQGEVKLTDFGISKELDAANDLAASFVGTANYLSPEVCSGEPYGFLSDIWSSGLVLFELATGTHPYEECYSFAARFEAVCELPEPRLAMASFPEPLCEFVACCLTRDVALRAAALTLSRHEFLTKDVPTMAELANFFATPMSSKAGAGARVPLTGPWAIFQAWWPWQCCHGDLG